MLKVDAYVSSSEWHGKLWKLRFKYLEHWATFCIQVCHAGYVFSCVKDAINDNKCVKIIWLKFVQEACSMSEYEWHIM
jgi:hypothetical protein